MMPHAVSNMLELMVIFIGVAVIPIAIHTFADVKALLKELFEDERES